jgi:hypothetical protein
VSKTKSVDRVIAETLGLPASNVHLTAEQYREFRTLLRDMRDALERSDPRSLHAAGEHNRLLKRADELLEKP